MVSFPTRGIDLHFTVWSATKHRSSGAPLGRTTTYHGDLASLVDLGKQLRGAGTRLSAKTPFSPPCCTGG